MRCSPGDICIIIGEDPSCTENIGAQVTVTHYIENPEGSDGNGGWAFEDASRLLKTVCITDRENYHYIRSSAELIGGDAWIPEKFLMPIKPKGEYDAWRRLEKFDEENRDAAYGKTWVPVHPQELQG